MYVITPCNTAFLGVCSLPSITGTALPQSSPLRSGLENTGYAISIFSGVSIPSLWDLASGSMQEGNQETVVLYVLPAMTGQFCMLILCVVKNELYLFSFSSPDKNSE